MHGQIVEKKFIETYFLVLKNVEKHIFEVDKSFHGSFSSIDISEYFFMFQNI